MQKNYNIFKKPKYLTQIKIKINKIKSICPISKKKDEYIIKIIYTPKKNCLSISDIEMHLKEYENKFLLSENLVNDIALFVKKTINASKIKVKAIKFIDNNKIITNATIN